MTSSHLFNIAMDSQCAAPPQTPSAGDDTSRTFGTTTSTLEREELASGPSAAETVVVGQRAPAEGDGVPKLTGLPPLGGSDEPPDRPVIAVMGCVVQDIVVKPNGPLTANGSTMSRIAFAPGGFGPNVAWTAALEGASVRFVGHAGADTVGAALTGALREVGIDVAVTHRGTTCCVLVLVEWDGQRTMAYDTSSFCLSAGDVTEEQLAGVSLLHLYENMFDDITADGAWKAVELVRRNGGLVSLDVGNIARVQLVGREEFMKRVEKIAPEILFANEEEAAALWPEGNVSAPGLVVVKHGPLPSVVYAADGQELLTVHVPPVPEVVDTTGAGDAMAGGFLAAWASGSSLEEAVQSGHRTAGAVVSQLGAQLPSDWLPSRPAARSPR
ncbi:MAG TPA: PfkB family carbohydrate kinase [Acidimicrobiales bacterium]|nr:PfkB family carbohydrate kinase [Acidimicrobiales bacterium]